MSVPRKGLVFDGASGAVDKSLSQAAAFYPSGALSSAILNLILAPSSAMI